MKKEKRLDIATTALTDSTHTLFNKYFIVIPGKAFKGLHKPAIMGKGCLLLRDRRNVSSRG